MRMESKEMGRNNHEDFHVNCQSANRPRHLAKANAAPDAPQWRAATGNARANIACVMEVGREPGGWGAPTDDARARCFNTKGHKELLSGM